LFLAGTLTFAFKARAYPSGTPLASSLTRKY
jgi:hypothetical protein